MNFTVGQIVLIFNFSDQQNLFFSFMVSGHYLPYATTAAMISKMISW